MTDQERRVLHAVVSLERSWECTRVNLQRRLPNVDLDPVLQSLQDQGLVQVWSDLVNSTGPGYMRVLEMELT